MSTSCELPLRWVSPLNPEATEIARYSAQLLPYLARFAQIAALEDGQGEATPDWWDAGLAASGSIPGVAPLPVYHIGNNAAHLPIYEQSRDEPGLVVLHDLCLVDLARHISRQWDDPDWWKRQMLRQYGESVSGLVHRCENSLDHYNQMTAHYPLFLPFVEDALGVVVHSNHARQALTERLTAGAAVRYLDLPGVPSGEMPARDYGARPLQFVFCGHVGPNRRLIEFFEAWCRVSEPEAFRLHLYGKIHNFEQLLKHADRCGVSSLLEIHGYVPDAELDAALRSAHFAINLRWPTMGEASASQLRYWSAGLPSLVTDVGWYAELPDEVVCKIPVTSEIPEITRLLQDILADPDAYGRLGQRGREYLGQRHGPEVYARQLASFSRELIARRLACRTVEQDLVGLVADLCEDGLDVDLFTGAIETAVATMGPEPYQHGEQ